MEKGVSPHYLSLVSISPSFTPSDKTADKTPVKGQTIFSLVDLYSLDEKETPRNISTILTFLYGSKGWHIG
jgi:hypothetical protein